MNGYCSNLGGAQHCKSGVLAEYTPNPCFAVSFSYSMICNKAATLVESEAIVFSGGTRPTFLENEDPARSERNSPD